ncbi:MAG TPA: TadE/TadG family type IV pilus assembly protein [Bryobacteraceae bacterium]|nr:TadE/TadG family type IV pilus assembly protein [Bryobacteraceae bacterium]
MYPATSKSRRRRRGAAMIEATLIIMLFLTIVFSIFDFAFVTFQHQTLLHQVRSAARYGVIADWPCETADCTDEAAVTAVKNMVLYGKPEGGTTPMFGLNASMIEVTKPGVRHSVAEQIVVKLSGYKYTVLTPVMAGVYTGKTMTVSLPMEEYAP